MWELTIIPEEVVEQLEEGEAVPALRGLDLQSGIHINGIEGQEVFCMLHHEVCPPCKRLETQQEGKRRGEQWLQLTDEMTHGKITGKKGTLHTTGAHQFLKGIIFVCVLMYVKGLHFGNHVYLLPFKELGVNSYNSLLLNSTRK